MATVHLKFDDMMSSVIEALKILGGSGTNEEINEKVSEIEKIPADQYEVLHNPEKGGMTEIEYRLMWTRTYLKLYGFIENSTRGVWSLTEKGSTAGKFDQKDVVRFVRELSKKDKKEKNKPDPDPNNVVIWQEELLDVILNMSPAGFERLTQRLLRESGFTQVEVTGKSGDGGIDGHGILRMGGLLSFHVIFQAKRWKGAISSSQIRDFRGAMVGRADKGLFITTGAFTKDAIKESVRDGAPAIDLVDGDQLVEKLKQLSLGVIIKKIEIEEITIDEKWFLNI
jgi:restriction system protein